MFFLGYRDLKCLKARTHFTIGGKLFGSWDSASVANSNATLPLQKYKPKLSAVNNLDTDIETQILSKGTGGR